MKSLVFATLWATEMYPPPSIKAGIFINDRQFCHVIIMNSQRKEVFVMFYQT